VLRKILLCQTSVGRKVLMILHMTESQAIELEYFPENGLKHGHGHGAMTVFARRPQPRSAGVEVRTLDPSLWPASKSHHNTWTKKALYARSKRERPG